MFGTQTQGNKSESNRKQTSLNRAFLFLQNRKYPVAIYVGAEESVDLAS